MTAQELFSTKTDDGGWWQLEAFVLHIYNALLQIESRRMEGVRLSLKEMFRMDVSVIQRSHGYDYFVNRVERGFSLSLSVKVSTSLARQVMIDWGGTLLAMLDEVKT